MPTQQFTARNSADTALPLCAEELVFAFLTDIPLQGAGGQRVSSLVIEQKIRSAKEQLEGYLDIKLNKQRLYEYRDFDRNQWNTWGHIKFSYFIQEVVKLYGYLNFSKQIEYPKSWLSIPRGSSMPSRNLHIIPGQDVNSAQGAEAFSVIFTGTSLLMMGISNPDYLPNYWRLDYLSGFDVLPMDLFDIIGKFASMQVLAILGDIAFAIGISSMSLGIDGLSQSISSTQSAENAVYSARIKQYAGEVKQQLEYAKGKYRGIRFTSL